VVAKNKKIKSISKASGKKPVYESPAIVILGELARGAGVCGQGSGPTGGTCTNGPTDGGSGSCSVGVVAGSSCSNGPLF